MRQYNCSRSQNEARYESGMRKGFVFVFLSMVHVGMSVDYDGLIVCFKCKIDRRSTKLAERRATRRKEISNIIFTVRRSLLSRIKGELFSELVAKIRSEKKR